MLPHLAYRPHSLPLAILTHQSKNIFEKEEFVLLILPETKIYCKSVKTEEIEDTNNLKQDSDGYFTKEQRQHHGGKIVFFSKWCWSN
jgi:hypothetical protein